MVSLPLPSSRSVYLDLYVTNMSVCQWAGGSEGRSSLSGHRFLKDVSSVNCCSFDYVCLIPDVLNYGLLSCYYS